MKPLPKNNPSLIVIITWLGPFPPFYELWKKTVSKNPSINWLVVSDNKPDNSLKNVKHIHYTNKDLVKLIFKNCGVEVDVDFKSYKLCDFKPMFADMFNKYIKNFDFWAFGDFDVMYGDIRKSLGSYLEKYEVVGTGPCNRISGHLCFFKNKTSLNTLYKKMSPDLFKGSHRAVDEKHMTQLVKKSGCSFNFDHGPEKEIMVGLAPLIWKDGNFYKYKKGKFEKFDNTHFHFGGGNRFAEKEKIKKTGSYKRKTNLVPSLKNIDLNKTIYINIDFKMSNLPLPPQFCGRQYLPSTFLNEEEKNNK